MAKSTHEIAIKDNEKPLCTNIAWECKLIAGRKGGYESGAKSDFAPDRGQMAEDRRQ
jgi:hypothetical protein